MQNDIDMLNNIRKTTEMGQYGINSVINYASDTELYRALKRSRLSTIRYATRLTVCLRRAEFPALM